MKILIAEDDSALFQLLPKVIKALFAGADVKIYSDAMEIATTIQALAEQKDGWQPDVVVSDFHLINGTGDIVLALAATRFPNARLILMSGGATADQVAITKKVVEKEVFFLQKPFTTPELFAAIQGTYITPDE